MNINIGLNNLTPQTTTGAQGSIIVGNSEVQLQDSLNEGLARTFNGDYTYIESKRLYVMKLENGYSVNIKGADNGWYNAKYFKPNGKIDYQSNMCELVKN